MGALALGAWGVGPGSRPVAGSDDLTRSFKVTYDVRLPVIPPHASKLKLWIPLASSDQHQRINARIIQSAFPYQVTQDPEYGNDILFLALERPLPPTLDLSVQYEAVVKGEQIRLDHSAAADLAMESELGLHLKSNRFMVVNDEIRQLARAVTAGAANPYEKARLIYRYVIERMTYEKETPGWGKGDTLRACQVGSGNCTDFHSLFISLARASNIPARFRIGLPVSSQMRGEIPGYHCWAEFYVSGVGWVPVDASEAWKDQKKEDYFFGAHDPNRLAVNTGRDIRLVPPSAQGPVNIFFKPHVEVDGKPFEEVETKFKFEDLSKKGGEENA